MACINRFSSSDTSTLFVICNTLLFPAMETSADPMIGSR